MRDDLDIALVRDFPNLYRMRNASMQETCMCWGFECCDGWEPLIRKLSEKLEKMILEVPEADRGSFCAAQVKQKFGTLRFYMDSETDEMSKAIQEAEEESATICEVCGKPGESRNRGSWLYTSCQQHKMED